MLICMSFVGALLATAVTTFLYDQKLILRQQEFLRAEAAVQAAFAHAQAMLCTAIAQYPDSATVWEELPGVGMVGTVLHIFQRAQSHQPARILLLPLFSGVQQPLPIGDSLFDSLPQLCDLNQPDQWIFEVDLEGKGVPISAPWVHLTPEKDAPLLARYAFLLEDESFKLNIQWASPQRSSGVLRNASDLSLQAILAQLPGVSPEIREKWTQELSILRDRLDGFKDLGQSNLVMNLEASHWDRWESLCTIFSEASNDTRHGLPRTNVNQLFSPTTSVDKIRQQLDQFLSTLRRESPHFGQRFYRLERASLNDVNAVQKKHEEIYLNKLAANIRDVLLPGPNPTRVLDQAGFPVLASHDTNPVRPAARDIGPNPLAAIGKKRVPYLQEYALAARLISIAPASRAEREPLTGAKFEMTLDHFLEFWNMSDKPIPVEALGPNARLILRNQPPWDLDGGGLKGFGIPPPHQRDLEIPLSNFRSFQNEPLVFQPGKATVLTTFPDLPPPDLFPHGAQFFTPLGLDPQRRTFSGVTYQTHRDSEVGKSYYVVRTDLRCTGNADYETECLLVNDQGWIDGFGYLPILGNNIAMRENNGQEAQRARWHIRSSDLQGTKLGPAQVGDPRTLNEQLLLGERNIAPSRNAALDDLRALQNSYTRFLQTARADHFPGKRDKGSSFGLVRGSHVDFEEWGDPVYTEDPRNNSGRYTPAVFPETPLKSIAELGHVFDPSRVSSFNIGRARGGGRSLRIGQPEFYPSGQQPGIWDRDPLSPSREWTAWRLCDIFSITDQPVLPGAVNINGVLRHQGALLKALLHDFRWSQRATAELRGRPLQEQDIELIVDHFQRRLSSKPPYETRGGAFFERGEISEIDLFQSDGVFPITFANHARVGLKKRNDTVREEIVRYLMEAITTRGRVFSVYCLGQAIRLKGPNKLQILATRKAKFTFRLVPLDENGNRRPQPQHPLDTYNKEIKPPDRYGAELLARED
ncbi:MAG: hypothetical protein C5B47_01580 [Verrucomicrobia bacterium]|nr:MAG: hypothetical protein C5B47_01580 [Verrucomicrobiota bacterium]